MSQERKSRYDVKSTFFGTFLAALTGPRLIPKLGKHILILGYFAQGFGLLVMLGIVLYSGISLSGLTLAWTLPFLAALAFISGLLVGTLPDTQKI